jgi:cyclopropane fatty-acyl-phospholipid synthase-like methyltransferase
MSNSTTIPHFFRLCRGDTIELALARHRQYLWSQLGLKPGMRVLEIGSGYGTAAMELYNFAGVSVVGIDNNSSKVEYHDIHRFSVHSV